MVKDGKRPRGEADVESTKIKNTKSAKTSRQPTHVEDIPDSEEDPGHSASLQFLAATKEPSRQTNPAVASHMDVLEKQKQRLRGLLDDEALKMYNQGSKLSSLLMMPSTTRDTLLKASLITLLSETQRSTQSRDTATLSGLANDSLTAHAFYRTAKLAVSSSRDLIAGYDRACEQIASGEIVQGMESGWADDCQTLRRILGRQGEKSKVEAYQGLHGEGANFKAQAPNEISATDDDLWSRIAGAPSKNGQAISGDFAGKEWATVAKHAQRGVHRMVKDLPEDSE